jgi:hypothetical protein
MAYKQVSFPLSHIQKIGCGVTIYVKQQGQLPANPEGIWYGSEDSGAVLSFDPSDEAMVNCVRDRSGAPNEDPMVNIPIMYMQLPKQSGQPHVGTAKLHQALIQVDHLNLVVDRIDPNVNNEVIDQVAIDSALYALFKVLLPNYVYQGNIAGLQ